MATTRRRTDACERTILELLAGRDPASSICPSDAARALGEARREPWRPLMDDIRAAAGRLRAHAIVEVTQRGVVVDPATAKGAIRIRRGRDFGAEDR